MRDNHAITDDSTQRMWQEAEVYESQGLYEQAVAVYRNILNKDPENRRAQAKVVQINFARKMAERIVGRPSTVDDLSPQLSMDLGLAYMGMNLYDEALEAFNKSLALSPAFLSELLPYMATCFAGLQRSRECGAVIEQLVSNRWLTGAAKGEIVKQMVEILAREDRVDSAEALLQLIPGEVKRFVPEYEKAYAAIKAAASARAGALSAYDATVGQYSYALSASMAEGDKKGGAEEPKQDETSILFNAQIKYSFDNKHWLNGMLSRLSADWALIHLPAEPQVGESLVLQIHLPTKVADEPVWVLARITQTTSELQTSFGDYPVSARAEFVSFLPGGEALLKGFIDELVKDPAVLARTSDVDVSGFTERAVGIYNELQEEAARAMEPDFTAEPVPENRRTPEEVSVTSDSSGEVPQFEVSEPVDFSKIRFACECGKVHVVPRQTVGRKGKCHNCGRPLRVPQVDTKPDRLSEKLTGRVIGGCRLLFKIGGGGMGGVFRAHHIGLDIPVAVKILYAHLADKDPVFITRFIREARAAAKLQHPNIVGVMNVGFEGGVHYLVMPFVGGGSAASLLARMGRLSVDKVLQIGIEIAEALSVAEAHNLLHRDIKPANILFNARGEAMLADLGLVKSYVESQDSGVTQTGIACGTPLYFSPEQAKGTRRLDIRSDIYSLGITLYQLLNGTPPFTGESAFVIFQKHVHDPLPRFKAFEPPVPEPVFEMLQKMTAKNPDDRFGSAPEVITALAELKADLAKRSARAVAPPEKQKSWLQKLGLKRSK
jgi:eukaryotic-like serine/threonine-protein kinase